MNLTRRELARLTGVYLRVPQAWATAGLPPASAPRKKAHTYHPLVVLDWLEANRRGPFRAWSRMELVIGDDAPDGLGQFIDPGAPLIRAYLRRLPREGRKAERKRIRDERSKRWACRY